MTTPKEVSDTIKADFAKHLTAAFTADPFVGMLNAHTIDMLAKGLLVAIPLERVMGRKFTADPDRPRETPQSHVYDYVKPYMSRAWEYFPFAGLWTKQFRELVMGLVAAELLAYKPGYAAILREIMADLEKSAGLHV